MSLPNKFNIRVYGLLINGHRQVLVSDERYGTRTFSKFPGGGLEFGEGIVDCLKREYLEEANQPITVVDHFYTTEDFFHSSFNANQQVISIYFLVKPEGDFVVPVSDVPFNFREASGHEVVFRWVDIATLHPEQFTFPIDKIVVQRLSNVS